MDFVDNQQDPQRQRDEDRHAAESWYPVRVEPLDARVGVGAEIELPRGEDHGQPERE